MPVHCTPLCFLRVAQLSGFFFLGEKNNQNYIDHSFLLKWEENLILNAESRYGCSRAAGMSQRASHPSLILACSSPGCLMNTGNRERDAQNADVLDRTLITRWSWPRFTCLLSCAGWFDCVLSQPKRVSSEASLARVHWQSSTGVLTAYITWRSGVWFWFCFFFLFLFVSDLVACKQDLRQKHDLSLNKNPRAAQFSLRSSKQVAQPHLILHRNSSKNAYLLYSNNWKFLLVNILEAFWSFKMP